MTALLIGTHLAAVGLGALIVLLCIEPATEGEKPVASKFISILDDIGTGLKKFFTSPLAANLEIDAIDLSEVAWPALSPLLNGLKAAIGKAQTLAAAANITGDTTAQVTALALSDAQSVFQAYEKATGTTIETAKQQSIIEDFLDLLAGIPSGTASAAPAPASTGSSAVAAAVSTIVAAPDPAPAKTAATARLAIVAEDRDAGGNAGANATDGKGPGLHNVVPE